ncbi:xanthine dehydrogenase accessory protein XdhC [Salipiger pallidus]|uniref:Xanthine dehydrogenase accessory protein XdhC n=1 Tax=Salipiger pallidus TaxID=1775170 RepID=A0A8J2ZN08_9RHOB|nr:xanthine dehydrogenase accessory protein XdhC [Salipiger pallidus]GGG82916.1 xanthine dehydrogenase accessory protein XdhC [Salipiger pallidus]
MGFDLAGLRVAVAHHGRVARVVVADVAGSAPREVGAAMLVWEGGQLGSIGGGALELMAAGRALGAPGLTRHPLGPQLGQCCGGSVTLLTELYGAAELEALDGELNGPVMARGPGEMPMAVRRLLDRARARGIRPEPQLVQGWMVEPMAEPSRQVWVWGAGHVGRAVVATLAPLPDIAITWADTGPERFPESPPEGVRLLPAPDLPGAVFLAPLDAEHIVLTYSHELDLALCHALLGRGFRSAGVIGSDTKWARFRKRLQSLGHSDAQISRIDCPIGEKSMGKHPQAIAIGVAADLLMRSDCKTQAQDTGGDSAWTTHFSGSGG